MVDPLRIKRARHLCRSGQPSQRQHVQLLALQEGITGNHRAKQKILYGRRTQTARVLPGGCMGLENGLCDLRMCDRSPTVLVPTSPAGFSPHIAVSGHDHLVAGPGIVRQTPSCTIIVIAAV
jgi:hypothetical protein